MKAILLLLNVLFFMLTANSSFADKPGNHLDNRPEAPAVSLDCSADDKTIATMVFFHPLKSSGHYSISGNKAFDNYMIRYIETTFSEDEIEAIQQMIDGDNEATSKIVLKSGKLQDRGVTGQAWMLSMVKYFKDANNGLCTE